MSKKTLLSFLGILIFSSTVFFSYPKQAHANILEDIFNGIKNIFTPSSHQLSVTSNFAFAPNGDINKDGIFNAGDTIRFKYVITNTTGKAFPFVTLETNIDNQILNSIHNLQGAVSITVINHKLIIPNLNIQPYQQLTISFDASSNFNKNTDQLLSTEPELFTPNNTSVGKTQKSEITLHKTDMEIFNKFVHTTK